MTELAFNLAGIFTSGGDRAGLCRFSALTYYEHLVFYLGFPVVMALTSSAWDISFSCLDVVSLARQISIHLLGVSLFSANSFFRVLLSLTPTTTHSNHSILHTTKVTCFY